MISARWEHLLQKISASNNAFVSVKDVLSAKINGGFADTKLGQFATSVPPITIVNSNDSEIRPGFVLIGSAPNENEVTLRQLDKLDFEGVLSLVVKFQIPKLDGYVPTV